MARLQAHIPFFNFDTSPLCMFVCSFNVVFLCVCVCVAMESSTLCLFLHFISFPFLSIGMEVCICTCTCANGCFFFFGGGGVCVFYSVVCVGSSMREDVFLCLCLCVCVCVYGGREGAPFPNLNLHLLHCGARVFCFVSFPFPLIFLQPAFFFFFQNNC
ncbi:hypothetical protein TbgDal_II1290 [Trypanosoma brucei gambiense DAL972]|uniref:Uncharacterized protein n=1 Tax=Trypanosoma brucei gambiense (strain MHOM/CI/86/DAL972) TaxID=679716 RepID=C9ZJ42_TRYB9|nr:hypothetical protein TbgDal_II1290 [Trypanosoma brucei gambiense DAL972]CBH09400.1 hypothetical protein TbgDal_II1290 [Trypanosoma brucei gambiense DAL972]|eukprot:XP_011771706.1 hypothetical protein TbgDal_II1290 [Trypanosoma brucei gambiense DAL972]